MTKTEEIITPTKLVKNILRKMKYGGHSPTYQNIFTKIYSHSTLFAYFVTWVLQVIFIFTATYDDFGYMIMDIVVLAAVWQITMKPFTAHWKRKYLLKLIDIIYNKFWTDDMLTEEERRESQEIYRYTRMITKGYTISIYFTFIGHSTTAMLRGNHNLIMNPWLPESVKEILFTSPYFEILTLFQFYLMASCTISGLLQMDNLFVTAIAVIIAQFRMIKSKLLSLGKEGKYLKDSKLIFKCIDQHNMLFEAIAIMEIIFSALVLHLYGSNITLGVVTLLGLLIENDITQLIELVFILISVFAQLYIYCLLGQLIQDEAISVTEAAYNCKWEDIQDINLNKSLVMIIQRSQKAARLTMGGMLILCLENFTRISRLMLSILTLMINMKVEV